MDHFVCASCGAIRLQPAASSDDYEYDEGHWRACGNPICGPCTRAGTSLPEYARHMTDGSD